MGSILKRPETARLPDKGLMRHEHVQIAYVTNDIERAVEVFRKRYGISEFASLAGRIADDSPMNVRVAWAGGTMYEIIEATGPAAQFYNARLPEGEFAIRHHHFAHIVQDREAWSALMAELAMEGIDIVFEKHRQGFMRFCYVKAPDLDHYLEFFLLEKDGIAFFESIPSS